MLLQNFITGSNDNEVPDQAIREQLVWMLGKCKTEEVMIKALERTLESRTQKLESEKNQQYQLQKQLQTIMREKEELQKFTHKAKMHFQRTALAVEDAER